MDIQTRAKAIKLVISDVDGVLTDGKIYIGNDGELCKAFDIQDGLGIKLLQKVGIEFAVITGRQSKIVEKRMHELGIEHVYQGQINKIPAFEALLAKLQISPTQVAYVGDDLPDLPLIQRAGLGISVANGHPIIKEFSDYTTEHYGGNGAIREICEMLLLAQDKFDNIIAHYTQEAN